MKYSIDDHKNGQIKFFIFIIIIWYKRKSVLVIAAAVGESRGNVEDSYWILKIPF